MGMGRVLVYGGHGALGRAIVSAFRSKNWGAVAADFSAGGCNLGDIQLNREENADGHVRQVRETLGTQKLDCIVHAAGGWIPGDVQGDLSAFETMWRMNSMSALATAHIASHHLKENGLLVLTGAHVALNACSSMHSYAVSKNAVHFLTKSLADPNCETLPSGAIAVAVLPITIDTPTNREAMPTSDFSSWTPPHHIAEKILSWATGAEHAKTGALYSVFTENNITRFEQNS